MNLDATVSEILAQNRAVTLDALGGIAAIHIETADSALFPHVADAVVAAWPDLSAEDRTYAVNLFRAALGKTTSGLGLNDTCLAIVPHASGMGIALQLKDALRDKVAIRTSHTSGALAATALRWLAHLAIINDEARPALADVLVGVARGQSEVMSFAVAAAQVAAITYDCWRDANATACLDRLTNSDAEADAWFGLGRARLVDALEARSQDTIVTGLREARKCFEYARTSGEDRIDAALYSHILRFVTEWASGATPAMLGAPLAEAEAALLEYVIGGSELPAEPMWFRARFEAENAWIVAVRQLRRAMDSGRDGQPWYAPAVAISALADAYCTANSLRPRRASADATATSFADLVAPRLVAPFLANADRLAYVEIWLSENDSPDANVFVQMVRTAANAQVMLPKAGAVGKHPAVEQLLGVDPAELPDGGVLDLIEMRLQDRAALDRLRVRPVVGQVIESTLDELSQCPDFCGRVRAELEPVIVHVIRFLARCLDMQAGGDKGRTAYLFRANADERDLQLDLAEWFTAGGLYGLSFEAQHIGGGRIDLMFTFDGFRFVLELKREETDTTHESVKKYLRQAGSYQVTDVAVGMVVVLDLGKDPLAPHIRDNVWVDRVPSTELDGTDRFLAVVRIPGNRKSPSRLGAS